MTKIESLVKDWLGDDTDPLNELLHNSLFETADSVAVSRLVAELTSRLNNEYNVTDFEVTVNIESPTSTGVLIYSTKARVMRRMTIEMTPTLFFD